MADDGSPPSQTNALDTNQPPAGFYFQLQLVGNGPDTDNAFQEVSGLSAGLAGETVAEGGQHVYQHRLPATAKYSNLVLKRGFVRRDSALANWCQATLNANFTAPVKTHDLQLALLGAGGSPLATWSFQNAWPVRWCMGEFKSQENALAIENLEFTYSDFRQL